MSKIRLSENDNYNFIWGKNLLGYTFYSMMNILLFMYIKFLVLFQFIITDNKDNNEFAINNNN